MENVIVLDSDEENNNRKKRKQGDRAEKNGLEENSRKKLKTSNLPNGGKKHKPLIVALDSRLFMDLKNAGSKDSDSSSATSKNSSTVPQAMQQHDRTSSPPHTSAPEMSFVNQLDDSLECPSAILDMDLTSALNNLTFGLLPSGEVAKNQTGSNEISMMSSNLKRILDSSAFQDVSMSRLVDHIPPDVLLNATGFLNEMNLSGIDMNMSQLLSTSMLNQTFALNVDSTMPSNFGEPRTEGDPAVRSEDSDFFAPRATGVSALVSLEEDHISSGIETSVSSSLDFEGTSAPINNIFKEPVSVRPSLETSLSGPFASHISPINDTQQQMGLPEFLNNQLANQLGGYTLPLLHQLMNASFFQNSSFVGSQVSDANQLSAVAAAAQMNIHNLLSLSQLTGGMPFGLTDHLPPPELNGFLPQLLPNFLMNSQMLLNSLSQYETTPTPVIREVAADLDDGPVDSLFANSNPPDPKLSQNRLASNGEESESMQENNLDSGDRRDLKASSSQQLSPAPSKDLHLDVALSSDLIESGQDLEKTVTGEDHLVPVGETDVAGTGHEKCGIEVRSEFSSGDENARGSLSNSDENLSDASETGVSSFGEEVTHSYGMQDDNDFTSIEARAILIEPLPSLDTSSSPARPLFLETPPMPVPKSELEPSLLPTLESVPSLFQPPSSSSTPSSPPPSAISAAVTFPSSVDSLIVSLQQPVDTGVERVEEVLDNLEPAAVSSDRRGAEIGNTSCPSTSSQSETTTESLTISCREGANRSSNAIEDTDSSKEKNVVKDFFQTAINCKTEPLVKLEQSPLGSVSAEKFTSKVVKPFVSIETKPNQPTTVVSPENVSNVVKREVKGEPENSVSSPSSCSSSTVPESVKVEKEEKENVSDKKLRVGPACAYERPPGVTDSSGDKADLPVGVGKRTGRLRRKGYGMVSIPLALLNRVESENRSKKLVENEGVAEKSSSEKTFNETIKERSFSQESTTMSSSAGGIICETSISNNTDSGTSASCNSEDIPPNDSLSSVSTVESETSLKNTSACSSRAEATGSSNDCTNMKKCLHCSMLISDSSLVNCSSGHPCCSSCLFLQVKDWLSRNSKDVFACRLLNCMGFYKIALLRGILPDMIVDVVEEKLEKEYEADTSLLLRRVNVNRVSVPPLKVSSDDYWPPTDHWQNLDSRKPYCLAEIVPSSREFKRIHQLFHKTMKTPRAKILAVKKLLNPVLWQYYNIKKDQKLRQNPAAPRPERMLFHGVKKKLLETIYSENVDWRTCGVSHGVVFGQGTYFARDASYAHQFTDRSDPDAPEEGGRSFEPLDPCSLKELIVQSCLRENSADGILLKPSNDLLNDANNHNLDASERLVSPGVDTIALKTASNAKGLHPTANDIKATNISANDIKATNLSANDIIGSKTTANSIKVAHLSANGIKITGNDIEGPIDPNSTTTTNEIKGSMDTNSTTANDVSGTKALHSRFMMVARVFVGRYTRGRAKMRRPPPIDPTNPYAPCYDSLVNYEDRPTLFVVSDTHQYYPEYFIEYTNQPKPKQPTSEKSKLEFFW